MIMFLYDVIIIGAGAAGLMCAIEAGKRGRRVVVIDHTDKIGEKIRISGGGRCNFTNLYCSPDQYISTNPHFCRSALKRYSQHDFIALVEKYKIGYHEKGHGQLFCNSSATDIIRMLLDECESAGVTVEKSTKIDSISQSPDGSRYQCVTNKGIYKGESLVVACGGLSIPKIGASPFGFRIAEQFGHTIIPPRAGLVPLTFDPYLLTETKTISGVSLDPVRVHSQSGKSFDEAILFTHRGISGPAILQISSYWKPGEDIVINLLPDRDVFTWLKDQRHEHGKRAILTILETIIPHRLSAIILKSLDITGRIGDLSDAALKRLSQRIEEWRVKPSGSEGYRTAEVTLGGINTAEISSKTFESTLQPGLYFIGEVVDVTGHLGGFNFQWAWSSGWCAGQYA